MREYVTISTLCVLAVVWVADIFISNQNSGAFTAGAGRQPQQLQRTPSFPALESAEIEFEAVKAPNPGSLRTQGLLGFGLCFGVLAGIVRGASRAAGSNVARRAEGEIAVAEKTETKPMKYFENVPRSIVEKKTLEAMLAEIPKEQWDDPPEDSNLYILKQYAETYGEGKATKMGWYDFYYLRVNTADEGDFLTLEEQQAILDEWYDYMRTGQVPLWFPGPSGAFFTGARTQFRGPEPFAGDQTLSPFADGYFAKQYVAAMAFYREGLKPWQRGLEIGMAHGYFIIGPFVSLGPLRATPEAATVGLLCGVAIIGLASVGGLLFGATIKPTRFDAEGDKPAAGWQEMMNWHAVGGLGGAGFAHALLTVFGS